MNCNEFQYSNITESIEKSIVALELEGAKTGDRRRYHCPIFPEKVPQMLAENAEVLKHVIHPQVIQATH